MPDSAEVIAKRLRSDYYEARKETGHCPFCFTITPLCVHVRWFDELVKAARAGAGS